MEDILYLEDLQVEDLKTLLSMMIRKLENIEEELNEIKENLDC